jgi:hypothetical protein
VIGWHEAQVRHELAAEMALQGLAAGLVALALLALGSGLLAQISVSLPASLAGENPAHFAAGGFAIGASKIAVPVALTVWDWVSGPVLATLVLGICGWWMAADRKSRSLWAAIRA